MTNKQIEIDVKGTKACAWGLYIFLVRRHCRKRPMISLFFFFCCFLLVFFRFFLTGGVWHCVEVSVTVTPPFFLSTRKKKQKNPHTRPPSPTPNRPLLPAALGRGNYALLSLPFVWGASLGTVFTSAVAFFTSASPLVLSSFTAFPLRQQTQERGRTIGETKKEERGDLLTANH